MQRIFVLPSKIIIVEFDLSIDKLGIFFFFFYFIEIFYTIIIVRARIGRPRYNSLEEKKNIYFYHFVATQKNVFFSFAIQSHRVLVRNSVGRESDRREQNEYDPYKIRSILKHVGTKRLMKFYIAINSSINNNIIILSGP